MLTRLRLKQKCGLRLTLTKLIPRADQEAAIQRMVDEPTWAALDGSEPSAGKTVMHVEQGLRMGASVVVVVGPLGTVDGWAKTLLGQSDGEHELKWVTSTKDGMANYADLLAGKPGWYFIGRELFRTARIDAAKIKADLGIVDESQIFANRKSVGWKKLMQFQPMFKVACSGTWFGNKVENMWSVARWLWPDKVDRSFWRWVDEWLDTEYDHFAGKKVTGEKVEGAFASSLPCYVRIVPTLVELETPIQRWVDLSPVQRRMYDKLEKDLFVQAASDVLMTEVSIATRTRLRQLSMAECDAETVVEEVAGELVEKQRVWFPVDAKSSKFEELQEIIKENVGESMLILTDSAQFVDLAVHRLGAQAFAWRGGVSQEARNEAKQKFVDGEIKFIVAQVASIGEGVDGIQFGCNTVVWASKSDSNFLNKQALRRAHRTGQDRPVRQFEIMARDTIDDEQHLALLVKGLKIEAALAFDNAGG